MATLLSRASGNFTSASTWALVDSTSLSTSEAAATALITSYVVSSTFTPGAITIDAIAVKLFNRATTPTGTVSCALDQAGATVSGTEVTINVADLPVFNSLLSIEGGWTIFKFAAPVLLVAATAYSVKLKTSSSTQLSCAVSGGTNWSRMLRTITTQAPVAGDDMHVAGEYTGAGTSNTLTVTMDNTAATDFGSAPTAANSLVTPGIGISAKGVLTFTDTTAANPYLRLSNSLLVYNGGILNMGSVATPMPRDSRAILEFDQLSADGDYGLTVRNGGTFVAQGQSRTSGKNVVSCKLAADAPSAVNLTQSVSAASGNTALAANGALEPTNTSRLATTVTDLAVNGPHSVTWLTVSVTNVTQVFSIWIARGSGTNNRYCRIQVGTVTTTPPSTGFYVDADLQAGTIGTVTAAGTGTATSASITPLGIGFVVTIIGKVSSGAASPICGVFSGNAPSSFSYTGDSTNCFNYYGQALYTASALPSADLTVDTDTGWLAGDLIAVASTTRTYTDCEILALVSNATSTTLTTSQVATVSHSGTVPTQAEIINLTRNVVIRSTSSTLMAYVNIQAGATADIDWVQFYYLGESATGKRGVEVGSSTTLPVNFNMNYCSVHDCEDNGVYLFTSIGAILITNCALAYNVMWNLGTVSGYAVTVGSGGIAPTNWMLDHNIIIRDNASGGAILNDVGGTFTNNVVVGTAGTGIQLGESNRIGTFSGNVVHSCSGVGIALTSSASGILASFAGWRNSGIGIAIQTPVADIILDNPVLFGNLPSNITLSSPANLWLKSPIINSDSTFTTANGIAIGSFGPVTLTIDDGDFSTVSGIKTAHTVGDIVNSTAGTETAIILRNTKLGATTEVSTSTSLSERGYVSSQKHDQTAGNHVTWMKHGKVQSDIAIYRTAAPSLRMTPSMAALLSSVSVTTSTSSPVITAVQAYVYDWILVGDWVTSAGSIAGARVVSLNAGASTITIDRNPTTAGSNFITILRGKLPSAPPDKGFLIAANSGQTFGVGVWVRKQQENLITFSEDFSNAAWATGGQSTRTGGQTDWAGGATATQFLETATLSATHGLFRNTLITLATGTTYTVSFYVKAIGRQWLRFRESVSRDTWLDLTNGVAGTTNAAHTIVMTAAGSGWWRVTVGLVAISSSGGVDFYTATADNNSASFTGDVTKGFLIGGVQVEQGSTASIYQVTTTTAINGYNGYVNPRLMQRANPAIGIASDVVLDTMTSGNGVWEQLTGTTTAPSGDDGVIELYVDCEGTTGWVNVDDFSVT